MGKNTIQAAKMKSDIQAILDQIVAEHDLDWHPAHPGHAAKFSKPEPLGKSYSSSKKGDKEIADQVIENIMNTTDYDPDHYMPGPMREKLDKPTLASAYRSYKNSPHNPLSTAMKFVIHHIENMNKYKNADPDQSAGMDSDILTLMQKGNAVNKNGDMMLNDLRKFVVDNPHFIQDLLSHQRDLHKHITKNYPDIVKDGKVALTRGLNTKHPGQEHPLASYGDVEETGFGSVMHHRRVPLNNVWYTFMTGPKEGTSENYGNENEWLVSPHEYEEAHPDEIQTALPRSGWHNVKVPHPNHKNWGGNFNYIAKHIDDIVEKSPENAVTYFSKHPELNADHISKLINAIPEDAIIMLKNHPLVNKDHITQMIKKGHEYAVRHLWDHPLIDKSHLDMMAGYFPAESAKYISSHPLFDKSHIDKITQFSPGASALHLSNHPQFDQSHIDTIVKDAPVATADYLLNHPLFNQGHLDSLVDKSPYLAMINSDFAHHPMMNAENIDKLIEKNPRYALDEIRFNPSFNENHISKIIEKDPTSALAHLVEHPKFTESHIDRLIEKMPWDSAVRLSNSKDLSKKQITKMMDLAPSTGVKYLKDHPNFDETHAQQAIDRAPEYALSDLKNHPAFDKINGEQQVADALKNKKDPLEKAYHHNGTWYPDTPKEEHPEKFHLQEGTLSDGTSSWFLKPHLAKDRDMELYQTAVDRFKDFAPVKDSYKKMIGKVSADPDRHALVGGTRTTNGVKTMNVRSRHLLSALKNKEGYSLTHDGKNIILSSVRHSGNTAQPSVRHSWSWDGKDFNFLKEEKL